MDHPFEIACDPGKREKVLSERGLDLMGALEVFASQEGTKLWRTNEPDGSDRFETGGYLDGRFVLMVFCVRRRVVRHVIR